MWTREELKGRAKDCLRKYYWMAFLVSLIASLLGGNVSGLTGARSGLNVNQNSGGIGILFVVPYENATFAEFYAVLRKRPVTSGAVLPGYGPEQESVYTDYTVL